MLKPALEFYNIIHEKLVNENNTNVSLYAKTIELQISELLQSVNINDGVFYGISNFEMVVNDYIMAEYITALQLVKFKLKSLGYQADVNFISNLTIKL